MVLAGTGEVLVIGDAPKPIMQILVEANSAFRLLLGESVTQVIVAGQPTQLRGRPLHMLTQL